MTTDTKPGEKPLDDVKGGHTPGPWHVGQGGNLHANRVWTLDMRPVVNLCSMGMSPADIDSETQANARLIAAAPDLLEALERCEEYFDERADTDQPAACDGPIPNEEMCMQMMVRAALSKATGGKP